MRPLRKRRLQKVAEVGSLFVCLLQSLPQGKVSTYIKKCIHVHKMTYVVGHLGLRTVVYATPQSLKVKRERESIHDTYK